MKTVIAAIITLAVFSFAAAQEPDVIYMNNVKGVKFSVAGNQVGYPIVSLGAPAVTQLDFDDLDGYVKTYNYTFVLCDADWQPAELSPFEYLKGYSEGRFSIYTASSMAKIKYVHYQIKLPEAECMPIKTGNYLLKVYLNSDTSQLAFTRRMLITTALVPIAVTVQHPFNSDFNITHQKIQFTIDKTRLNILNPQQQLKVVVLQNYRWDNAITGMQPVFMRGNLFEYNGEQDFLFQSGKEYRWANLESYRLLSDRVESASEQSPMTEVYMKPDFDRVKTRYQAYKDYDGFFAIASSDVQNAWSQTDYVRAHFIFVPPDKQEFTDKNVYLSGEMTAYKENDSTKMIFNPDKGWYEKSFILKQGYYTYNYVTKPMNDPNARPDFSFTEGNYWETENNYTVLVYYRSFSDRCDELVGVSTVSSVVQLK